MSEQKPSDDTQNVSRDRLAELLNEDLAREYQAIIAYVVYSQVLKGAEFMSIATPIGDPRAGRIKACSHYLSSN